MTEKTKTTGDISELRDHLFATLRGLRDKDAPIDLDRARAISQVAGTIIDSARVEVEFAKVTGRETTSGFLPGATDPDGAPLPPGITGIRRHRLQG
jgi:hypothetical protein